MKITEYLSKNILILDGGMGTLLQEKGLMPGEMPERWNITRPEVITGIHREYFKAGSNVVSTNTFGANILKFDEDELRDIISAAVACARNAADGKPDRFVALDVGPLGRMLKPYGDLEFSRAVEIFSHTVRLGAELGVDLVFIETMNDSYETKAALLAAKESCSLPVFVSNAYGEDGKLMTGATPAAMVAMLEGMGADAIGVNCSLGPKALAPVVREYLECASVPVLVKPNAGLPRVVGDKTVYDVAAADFAKDVSELARLGASMVGGCCGTTPEYIKAIADAVCDLKPMSICEKNISAVSSYTHAVTLGERPVLIGERINPTGKKRFKEALRSKDISYILGEGIAQAERGAHVLDVNVGLPEIDECEMLVHTVQELQAVVDLPLQIDSSDPVAMGEALRVYNGKAMINSVSGKRESMDAVFPLVKKYGGVVVALTLDENGIPESAEGRLEIARKILNEAKKHGIAKKDIIFDPLALTVSADKNAAVETLRAVELITKELGAHTSLGVSNVSFGLPMRDVINSAFFTAALGKGLTAAILNPYSEKMMNAYHAHLALAGLDDSFSSYISYAEGLEGKADGASDKVTGLDSVASLSKAIIKGLKSEAAVLTERLLATKEPLAVVTDEIIPALDTVGIGFEKKTVYLPQLLMAAEAAKAAFEVVAAAMPKESGVARSAVVLATVKGDIHDIGKNIVKLLLENYGFAVTDLGRDVSPECVLRAVVDLHAPILGLSALMTTTVPAMAETVAFVHREAPWCRIMVGGAVLTEEYAMAIGADKYAKDAMGAVRYAEAQEAELLERGGKSAD